MVFSEMMWVLICPFISYIYFILSSLKHYLLFSRTPSFPPFPSLFIFPFSALFLFLPFHPFSHHPSQPSFLSFLSFPFISPSSALFPSLPFLSLPFILYCFLSSLQPVSLRFPLHFSFSSLYSLSFSLLS